MDRRLITTLVVIAPFIATFNAQAQIAGSTTLGVEVSRLEFVAAGWSAKKQLLGKTVRNENGAEVGKIDDLIIAPDNAVSFVIIGAGGFVGLKRHQVAIPTARLVERDGAFVLEGATKTAIKALPAFEYADHPRKANDAEAPSTAQQ
jgi:sporulation protein YlmC with PRC-barrel domain